MAKFIPCMVLTVTICAAQAMIFIRSIGSVHTVLEVDGWILLEALQKCGLDSKLPLNCLVPFIRISYQAI